MPITVPMVMMAVVVAGAAVSAYGAVKAGQAANEQSKLQEKMARRQADITDQQAGTERDAASAREGDFRRQQSALMARRRAILGASGIDQATGSPLLVSDDFTFETELMALRIRSGGEINATRLEQQAGLQRAEGSLLRLGGKNAQTAGYIRGGATLLSAAGSAWGGGFGATGTQTGHASTMTAGKPGGG